MDSTSLIFKKPINKRCDKHNLKLRFHVQLKVWGCKFCRKEERGLKVNRLPNNDYQKYLKSDHWKKVRVERLKIDGDKCLVCMSKFCLNVHHVNYKNIGAEQMEDLRTLCEPCHKKAHLTSKGKKISLNKSQELIARVVELQSFKSKSKIIKLPPDPRIAICGEYKKKKKNTKWFVKILPKKFKGICQIKQKTS